MLSNLINAHITAVLLKYACEDHEELVAEAQSMVTYVDKYFNGNEEMVLVLLFETEYGMWPDTYIIRDEGIEIMDFVSTRLPLEGNSGPGGPFNKIVCDFVGVDVGYDLSCTIVPKPSDIEKL